MPGRYDPKRVERAITRERRTRVGLWILLVLLAAAASLVRHWSG